MWAAAPVFMYPLGVVYAATIRPASTPPTVLVGALLVVVGGGWISWRAMRQSSIQVGAEAELRVH